MTQALPTVNSQNEYSEEVQHHDYKVLSDNYSFRIQVRDRAWFVRIYDETIIDSIGGRTMFYFNCSMIPSVDLACHGISRAKDLVSGKVATRSFI